MSFQEYFICGNEISNLINYLIDTCESCQSITMIYNLHDFMHDVTIKTQDAHETYDDFMHDVTIKTQDAHETN
jgi:hypothetical protein